MARYIDPIEPRPKNVIFDDDRDSPDRIAYYNPISRLVWTVFGIIAVILALRFVLRAIGASPAAEFTDFIYDISAPLVTPFSGTLANTTSGTGIVEWATIFAFIVYWLAAWVLSRLASMARPAPMR